MGRPLVVMALLASLILPGCTKAQAAAPDPTNLAQCIAAFQFGHHVLQHSSELTTAKYKTALSLTGRQIYYIQKLQAEGVTDGGAAESKVFAATYGNDEHLMLDLVERCGILQDNEPGNAASTNKLAQLVAKVDPICRENPFVCK